MKRPIPFRLLAAALTLSGAFYALPVGAQQAHQSTTMVAFGDEPAEKAAETAAETAPAPKPVVAIDPRRVVVPKTVAYGRVVPPAPRIALQTAHSAAFLARPAAATALTVNSRYGVRVDPITGSARMHTGVDLAAVYGEPVGVSMSGTVLWAGARGGYGNLVVVDHGSGVSTYYGHLSAVAVAVGQPIEAGQLIGYVGSTGRSTGPHLHYEVRANGHPFDPFAAIAVSDAGRLSIDGYGVAPRAADAFSGAPLPAAPGSTIISVDLAADTDTE